MGSFQDAVGQGARESHLGSLSHEMLDQMTFGGPFHPGLFCCSVSLFTLVKVINSPHLQTTHIIKKVQVIWDTAMNETGGRIVQYLTRKLGF